VNRLPVVAIVGRPNVGKSTLFNRIMQSRISVVDNMPGVTRDRVYGVADWNGREFHLIDTGGFLPGSEDVIERMVREQAEIAIEEADLILFMVDCRVGMTDLDQGIGNKLQKTNRPVIVVANKADTEVHQLGVGEFYGLGLGEPIDIAAANGYNIGDLLDRVMDSIPETEPIPETDSLKIAIVGRPNVGKSSFVNFVCGKNRQIVTDIPGTTRDSVDTEIEYEGQRYILIDTAGLRRKSKVKENLEFYTTLRTIKAVQRADVVAVLIEAHEGLLHQDIQVIEQVHEFRKGALLVVNKWDLLEEKTTSLAAEYAESIRKKIPTFGYLPIVFISAKTGQRTVNVLKYCSEVDARQNFRVQTSELNRFLEYVVNKRHPAAVKGKYIKLHYITQSEVKPPTFVIFCNYPKLLQRQYLRYIENRMRETWDFEGVPIRIKVKSGKRR